MRHTCRNNGSKSNRTNTVYGIL